MVAQDYGDYMKIGEVIGVQLDLQQNQLTFYKNGVSLGKAFDLPKGGSFYACVSLLNNEETDVQITLNSQASLKTY